MDEEAAEDLDERKQPNGWSVSEGDGVALKRKLVRPTFQGAHLGRVGLQGRGDLRENDF